MRIAVLELEFLQQQSRLREGFDHGFISGPDRLTTHQWRFVVELAVIAHRVIHQELIFIAHDIVVQAMARRGMHQTRTRFERDVIAADQRHFTCIEWMLEPSTFEYSTFHTAQHFPSLKAVALHAAFHQIARENQRAFGSLHKVVIKIWMYAYGLIRRQRPRRGGPNHSVGIRTQAGYAGLF